ncbi:MAG: cyclic nucleotide-binding domain-containing protein [Blastocatellia bacterium]|nr:cyclic nucleotide-binding domain-containing protein [Blastocatellia bacterium]
MNPQFEIEELESNEKVFLKECDLFMSLGEELIQEVLARGELLTLPAGTDLFYIGDPPDNFYVVKSGVVEICRPSLDKNGEIRPVAYLGSSDSMGEMAIVTGTSHGSMARMPEGGEIFRLSRREFHKLIDDFPVFARNLIQLFAHRLEARVKDMRVAKRHLHGNLRFFDLPTVIQTIVSTRLTGTLALTSEQQEPIAEVNFEGGEIQSAFMGELFGAEAFMQLFQPPPQDGNFDFKTGPIQAVGDSSFEIAFPTMNLLMESVRLQDELVELKQTIRDQDLYIPLSDELQWDTEDRFYPLALQIWLLLHERRYRVFELRATTLRCHYYCYKILYQLLETRQISTVLGV